MGNGVIPALFNCDRTTKETSTTKIRQITRPNFCSLKEREEEEIEKNKNMKKKKEEEDEEKKKQKKNSCNFSESGKLPPSQEMKYSTFA